MKTPAWKDVAELIGIGAIVASLIFVGIETRNSTEQARLTNRALEIAAYQDLMDNIGEWNMAQMQDPELAMLVKKAREAPDQLTELEQYQMSRSYFVRLRHGDMAYFHHERGVIDDERLASALEILNFSNPGMRAHWKRTRLNFAEAYRNHIDSIVDEYEAEDAANQ